MGLYFLQYSFQSSDEVIHIFLGQYQWREDTEDVGADELKAFLAKAADVKPEERPLLDAFFDEHVKERPGGGVMMDYTQETRWAVLCWRPL